GVVQVLLGVRRGHLLGEDLQAIAIRVEEIDALGEHVVGSELDPRAVALEPIVKLPKLLLAPFDLEGRVGQTGASTGWSSGTLMTAMSWSRSPNEKKAIC